MSQQRAYPVGTPERAWDSADVAAWRARQLRRRSYADDVLAEVTRLQAHLDAVGYGRVAYGDDVYALVALRSRDWDDALPCALVTGGVHGYETSGVRGALRFMDLHGGEYAGRINLLVAPCVSPWAYERVQRWNAEAVDPNRSFRDPAPALESGALMRLLGPLRSQVLVHIDLHETTDSDESEFRPALAARDGVAFVAGHIPDGFYVVGDSLNPQSAFHDAVIAAVARVTHIAPADTDGRIIGADVVSPGVILYPVRTLGLCAGVTDARYATTTEVYPDSPRATPEQCDAAQVAAIRAAIAFALDDDGLT